MVLEKLSPLQFGQEFVSLYYTLLQRAPETLQRFYGENSSYIHGSLDSNGKPAGAVYGQEEINRKLMSLSFSNCHVEIVHVDAQATLSDGVVVQVLGLLSSNQQEMRRFMQTFVLAPQGSTEQEFYVHNDIFRYLDEVFEGCITEPQGQSTKEVDEPEAKQEEPVAESHEEKPEATSKEAAPENTEKSPLPAPEEPASKTQEDVQPSTWASVVCKKLGPVTGGRSVVGKETASQPRPRSKPESQVPPQKRQRDKKEVGAKPTPRGASRPNLEVREKDHREPRRATRHPDSHQLFLGNLPHDVDMPELQALFQPFGPVLQLRIHSGGDLPNFGFVVFDGPAPVQKVLSKRPILLRGGVRLNVQEKKPREAREGDRRDNRLRGPGVPRGAQGSGQRGDLVQQPNLEVNKSLSSEK